MPCVENTPVRPSVRPSMLPSLCPTMDSYQRLIHQAYFHEIRYRGSSQICQVTTIFAKIDRVRDSLHNNDKEFTEFINLAVSLTTGSKPFPKRAHHIERSRASSFK
jgi:hypothetical protein